MKFWNDPDTIAWFRNEPAPNYWREFFQFLNKNKFSRVLDLGCGAGRNSEMLMKLGFDLYACDLEPVMVAETKRRLKNGSQIIVASMLKLPYSDNFFDAVVSNGVYHNASGVNEIDQALSVSSRILRKGGYLCFNLFSSKYIAPELKLLPKRTNVYLTAEGLDMTLISSEKFLKFAKKHSLKLSTELVEYEREVSTGKRSVMRGVLRKI